MGHYRFQTLTGLSREGVLIEPNGRRSAAQFIPVRRAPNCDQIAWCPPAYQDWYRHIRKLGFSKAEGRTFIEDQIAADERRAAR